MSDRSLGRGTLAGIAGAVLATAIILGSSGGDVERMTFGDGRLHRAVAMDLDADDPEVQEFLAGSGSALRYGRVGFPAVLWALSVGRGQAMPYVQPMIMVLCAAGIAAAAAALFSSTSVVWALAPFAAIGLIASLAGGFAEPLLVFFALGAVLMIQRSRPWAAAGALSAAMLVRETGVVVAVGLGLWLLMHHRRRDAGILALSAIPVATWHIIVATRFHVLPILDPWLYETNTVDTPVLAVLRTFASGRGSTIVILSIHLAVAAIGLSLIRTSDVGAVAGISGLSLLSVGSFTWGYIGDASRVNVLLEVFVILAVLHWVRSRTSRTEAMAEPAYGQPRPRTS